jgi:hypothetical protein
MSESQDERVGAILGANAETKIVKFLGYGTFQGCEVPSPDASGWMAESLRKHQRSNPKILLDSGKVVWGCECWWGPEDDIKAKIERYKSQGFTIVEVDIDEIRKEHK